MTTRSAESIPPSIVLPPQFADLIAAEVYETAVRLDVARHL